MSCYSMDKNHQSAGGGDGSKSKDGEQFNYEFPPPPPPTSSSSSFFEKTFPTYSSFERLFVSNSNSNSNSNPEPCSSTSSSYKMTDEERLPEYLQTDSERKTKPQKSDKENFWYKYFGDHTKTPIYSRIDKTEYLKRREEERKKEKLLDVACSLNNLSLDKNSQDSSVDLNQENCQNDKKFCNFCKQNGENSMIYNSHDLYNEEKEIICPVLLSCKCTVCKENGHTVSHCPYNSNKKSTLRVMRKSDNLFS